MLIVSEAAKIKNIFLMAVPLRGGGTGGKGLPLRFFNFLLSSRGGGAKAVLAFLFSFLRLP